jgi:heme a synthase
MEGRHRLFGLLAALAFAACYVTILLGGNVMASDSGLACPSWPTCFGTQLLPPDHGAAGIESAHRLGALVLSLFVLAVTVGAILWERRRPVVLRLSIASGAAVIVQALLGALVVESGLAVGVVLLHFALATVLFLLLLVLALIANLRYLPRRWRQWAIEASVDAPVDPYSTASGAPAPALPGPQPGDA